MEPGRTQADASIAWYKLADLITRKEREKALSVYRLLSHSLEDRAYALQLEGDLLWSFNDRNASEKYKQAAFLYRKEKRWVDALAIGEHLLSLEPNNFDYLLLLSELYAITDWQEKFARHFNTLISLVHKKIIPEEQLFKALKSIIECAQSVEKNDNKSWFYHELKKLAEISTPHIASLIKEHLPKIEDI